MGDKSHFDHRGDLKLKLHRGKVPQFSYCMTGGQQYCGGTTGHFEKLQVTGCCLCTVTWYISSSHLKEQFLTFFFHRSKHLFLLEDKTQLVSVPTLEFRSSNISCLGTPEFMKSKKSQPNTKSKPFM